MKLAIDNSDAIIKGSQDLPEELDSYIDGLEKPTLGYYSPEEFAEPYSEFYTSTVLQ
jgi:starch synthase